jgi:hypothetical protein
MVSLQRVHQRETVRSLLIKRNLAIAFAEKANAVRKSKTLMESNKIKNNSERGTTSRRFATVKKELAATLKQSIIERNPLKQAEGRVQTNECLCFKH